MKKVLLAAILAAGILAAGCSRESGQTDEGEAGTGSLRIAINGVAGEATRAVGDPSQEAENVVGYLEIFVFHHSTGVLEKYAFYNSQTLPGITDDAGIMHVAIDGLNTAYAKNIVVFANSSNSYGGMITNYSQLSGGVIGLENQRPALVAQVGMFMSGEAGEVQIAAGMVDPIEITIRRVAAKVRLTSLIFNENTTQQLADFSLLGVSVQKVPHEAYMLGASVPMLDPADGDYWGGLVGSVSSDPTAAIPDLDANFLYQQYAHPGATITSGLDMEPDIYFYVFPNNGTNTNGTHLTIHGEYTPTGAQTPVPVYFSFLINNEAGTGGMDGTFIQRNKVYTLGVTINNLGLGADNPDTIQGLADATLRITVADWEGTISQSVAW